MPADLAVVAARGGKNLRLDKPVAVVVDAARAVRDAGVASVVFFTDHFVDPVAHMVQPRGHDGWLAWRVAALVQFLAAG